MRDWQLEPPLWERVRGSLEKLKTGLSYDPTIPLLGIDPKEMKTPLSKDLRALMSTAALLTTAKTWKRPRWPSTGD